jgi:subtilisin family serine protease
MPKDFDPIELLENGKNPGLGIRKLHELGLNGKGVDIAIIDQPTLPNHIEYKDNIKTIIKLGQTWGPQPHGPHMLSAAVGKSCGVAPAANVYYFSMPMWEQTNTYYIQAINRILELNAEDQANIKIISISTGGFEGWPEFDEFQRTVALAGSNRISVLTCASKPTASLFDLGVLRPLSLHSREHPSDYVIGGFSDETHTLYVPGDNVTYASSYGDNVLKYSLRGGRSHAPPWLAGLVAISYQVNPNLTPEDIKKFLLDSAHKMPYGSVVNPAGFIELCRAK